MKTKVLGTIFAVMLFAFLLPIKAFAEDTYITDLDFTYNPDVLELNTAYKEGEVKMRVWNSFTCNTPGIRIADAYLVYDSKAEGSTAASDLYGTGDGQTNVREGYAYYIRIALGLEDDYAWSGAFETGNEKNAQIKINDILCTECINNFSYYNKVICIPVGKPSTAPIVTTVSIDQPDFSGVIGKSYDLTATVKGSLTPAPVSWAVEDNISTHTVIDSNGKLTIGADEGAVEITVTATAGGKTDKIKVTVLDEDPYIEVLSVYAVGNLQTPLYPGKNRAFFAEITGTETNRNVTWSVSGNTSSDTVISETGVLTLGTDETAEKVIIKATAVADTTKFATFDVYVTQRTILSEISVSFDMNYINVSDNQTLGDVNRRFQENVSTSSDAVIIDKGNSYLCFDYCKNQSWGISGHEDELVSRDNSFLFIINIYLGEAYAWQQSVIDGTYTGFTVNVNGKTVNVVKYENQEAEIINNQNVGENLDWIAADYSKFWNSLKIYIPIGKGKCHHPSTELRGKKNATCVAAGYTGDTYCTVCNEKVTTGNTIAALPHTEKKTVVSKASFTADGKIETKCAVCGKLTKTEVIHAVKNVKLSTDNFAYTGKAKKPTVSVKDSLGNTLAKENYSLKYSSGCKTIGKYTVTVTLSGDKYSGSKKLTFKINPPKPTLSSVKAGTKSMTLKWKKGKEATGYEIQYSTSKTFAKGNKTVKVTSAKATSKVVKNLKAKKTYYVRLRSYKTVKGTKYYSDWSAKKTVKTK